MILNRGMIAALAVAVGAIAWATLTDNHPDLSICWDDTSVIQVTDGVQPLLPSPRPSSDWHFVRAVVLNEEADGFFRVEYMFERSTKTTGSCEGIFDALP